MKKYIFIVTIFSVCISYAQKTYLNTQFIKDKAILEKELYKDLKKKGFYNEKDSIRIAFIYRFNDIDSTGFRVENNIYLEKVEPNYRYANYILPFLFKEKYPTKKRLMGTGYALNQNDSIIAVYNMSYPYEFRTYIYSETYHKEHKTLVDNVLKQKFDLCFTTLNGLDFIWCIKGNETFIYKVATGEMRSLQECYTQDLDILSVSDIMGYQVEPSIEQYFIRFR